MKYILYVLAMCVVTVSCQRPTGSLSAPQGNPVPISAGGDSKPLKTAPAQISPPRPKGCSPGCGAAEICVELGESYCRAGQICSVCIKMSSIRFPMPALTSMFSSQLSQQRNQQQQQMQQQQQQQPSQTPDSNQQTNMNSLLPFMLMDGFGLGMGF